MVHLVYCQNSEFTGIAEPLESGAVWPVTSHKSNPDILGRWGGACGLFADGDSRDNLSPGDWLYVTRTSLQCCSYYL